jgi:hypothetical protein
MDSSIQDEERSVMNSRRFAMLVTVLVPAIGASPLFSDAAAPASTFGRLMTQEKLPCPDGTTVIVKAGGAEHTCKTVGGRFEAPVPPGGPVSITIKDCAGQTIAARDLPPAKADDKGRLGPDDLGDIPIEWPAASRPVPAVVFSGVVRGPKGQPAPDGTEVAIGLARAGLFDSTKVSRGAFSLSLVDLENKAGGFKAGDTIVAALRLPSGEKHTPRPASWAMRATDMANQGVCRDIELRYGEEDSAGGSGQPPQPSPSPSTEPERKPTMSQEQVESKCMAKVHVALKKKYRRMGPLDQYAKPAEIDLGPPARCKVLNLKGGGFWEFEQSGDDMVLKSAAPGLPQ